jgi:hypothetical protein
MKKLPTLVCCLIFLQIFSNFLTLNVEVRTFLLFKIFVFIIDVNLSYLDKEEKLNYLTDQVYKKKFDFL